jgi:hypothetical protein
VLPQLAVCFARCADEFYGAEEVEFASEVLQELASKQRRAARVRLWGDSASLRRATWTDPAVIWLVRVPRSGIFRHISKVRTLQHRFLELEVHRTLVRLLYASHGLVLFAALTACSNLARALGGASEQLSMGAPIASATASPFVTAMEKLPVVEPLLLVLHDEDTNWKLPAAVFLQSLVWRPRGALGIQALRCGAVLHFWRGRVCLCRLAVA